MDEIDCPYFTETKLFEIDGEYMIAHGWTQSSGQTGRYHYKPPEGWQFDPRYSDIRGLIGSHGGCHDCLMTLVHLITIDPVYVPPPEELPPKEYEEPPYEELPYEGMNLCGGVSCEPECFGVDKYTTVCEDGVCVKDSLIKANDPDCGHTSPTPEDNAFIDFIVGNKEIIIVGTIAGVVALKYM